MNTTLKPKPVLERRNLIVLGHAIFQHRYELLSREVVASEDAPFSMRPLKPERARKILKDECRQLESALVALGVNSVHREEAKQVTFSTFSFEWYHLYDHGILASYCKPKLPRWTGVAKTYDEHEKLVDRAMLGPVDDALFKIFIDESSKRLGFEESYHENEVDYCEYYAINFARHPRSKSEIDFSLLVSDFTNPRYGRQFGPEYGSKNWEALERLLPVVRRKVAIDPNENKAVKEALNELSIEVTSLKRNGNYGPDTFITAGSYQNALNIITGYI